MVAFAGPTLLVIDELGYLPLPAEAASALFQVIAQRYTKTSIILTTNRGVGSWGEILGDTTVAAAMLDRLLHRSVVLNLDGDHRHQVGNFGEHLWPRSLSVIRDACRDYLRPGDQLVITRLSRVARSVRHLSEVAAELEQRRIDLVVLAQGLDTATPAGRLLFHMLGAIDEFTADLISEGTLEGLAAARARGRVGGRPTVMTPAKLTVARQMLDAGGHTVTEIAATIGVGRGTLYRHLATGKASGS